MVAASAHDSSEVKISVDLAANQLKITGHSGKCGGFVSKLFYALFFLPNEKLFSSFFEFTLRPICGDDPCSSDTLSIDLPVFTTPALTYNIYNTAKDFTFDDTAASSSNSLTSCGTFIWTVTNRDGSSLDDSSVFTLDMVSTTKKVTTETSD